MPQLIVGKPAPEIALKTDQGTAFRLSEHRGKPVVLTFYSEGATEGCTIQNSEFSALLPDFVRCKAVVAGISPEDAVKAAAFRKKHRLAHLLVPDPELKAIDAYGLWAQKKLWGHEYMGVLRTTVIVDARGNVAAILKATRIKGHAQKVLDALRGLIA
jgi:peroxiredoxin Q/BCP